MNEERRKYAKLVEIGIMLGKKKLVWEWVERCGYPGVDKDRREAKEMYEWMLGEFLTEAKRLVQEGGES